jgi:hypothetical protein
MTVGDDDDLGGTGEARRDADDAGTGDLALGHRHVDVAGPHDHVDGGDGLGAVGHGRHRLGAADREQPVDTGDRGGGEDLVGHPPLGTGRDAEHDLADARHLGRDGGHEHGRRVRGPTAGDVAAGPVHRAAEVADEDAVLLVHDLGGTVARWYASMLVAAASRAARSTAGMRSSAAASSEAGTSRSSTVTLSKRSVQARTAASPPSLTSARMDRTAATGPSPTAGGRGSTAARSPVTPRRSSLVSMAGGAYRRPLPCPEPVRAVGSRPAGEGAAMSEGPQLSSIASALRELTDRLSAIAETMTGADREDVATSLFEVERSLVAASRRLEEVLRVLR